MTQTASPFILVVDDELQNRKLMETLLRPAGYKTASAFSGEDALAKIALDPPDLILLDVMMPGIDGYEVARILKDAPLTSDIPIILLTALSERGARLAGLNAGAEEFLTKPVDRTELGLRVRNLLRLKALGDFQKQCQTECLRLNVVLEDRVRERTAQLENANRDLEAFSWSVAHDLRTPLGTIAGFSSMLDRDLAKLALSDRAAHYLARIKASVLHMSTLIDAMLGLAQLSRASLRQEAVDLSALARELMNACLEREPDRAAVLDIEPGMTAQGDSRLLRQVLDNLLGNAWKFTSQQAVARIGFGHVEGPDGKSTYAVSDNGAGFDMAHAGKLFGAFQRLHTQADFAGTGIGLATVQRIVARHGGRIWAEAAPGRGAAFFFTLPGPATNQARP
jgi:signal transduction histidine kinase